MVSGSSLIILEYFDSDTKDWDYCSFYSVLKFHQLNALSLVFKVQLNYDRPDVRAVSTYNSKLETSTLYVYQGAIRQKCFVTKRFAHVINWVIYLVQTFCDMNNITERKEGE